MEPTNQPQSKYDNLIKWSATTIFAIVVLGASYVIYTTSQGVKENSTATTQSVTITPTPNAEDTAVQGSPAPTTITNSTDLSAADQALDSSDIDSVTSDLSQNDKDLTSF